MYPVVSLRMRYLSGFPMKQMFALEKATCSFTYQYGFHNPDSKWFYFFKLPELKTAKSKTVL
jgi:hypothetical protein